MQEGGFIWQSYRITALVRRVPGPVRWACTDARPGKPSSSAPPTDTHGLKMVKFSSSLRAAVGCIFSADHDRHHKPCNPNQGGFDLDHGVGHITAEARTLHRQRGWSPCIDFPHPLPHVPAEPGGGRLCSALAHKAGAYVRQHSRSSLPQPSVLPG